LLKGNEHDRKNQRRSVYKAVRQTKFDVRENSAWIGRRTCEAAIQPEIDRRKADVKFEHSRFEGAATACQQIANGEKKMAF
jgi:hypothetical protein